MSWKRLKIKYNKLSIKLNNSIIYDSMYILYKQKAYTNSYKWSIRCRECNVVFTSLANNILSRKHTNICVSCANKYDNANGYYKRYTNIKNDVKLIGKCSLVSTFNEVKSELESIPLQSINLQWECTCGTLFNRTQGNMNSKQIYQCSQCITSNNSNIHYNRLIQTLATVGSTLLESINTFKYIKSAQNIDFKCKCGNIVTRSYTNIVNVKNNICTQCKTDKVRYYDLQNEIINMGYDISILQSNFKEIKQQHASSKFMVKLLCDVCNTTHIADWYSIRRRNSITCNSCTAHVNNTLYYNKIIQYCRENNKEYTYIYDYELYKSSKKLRVICPQHGEFTPRITDHYNSGNKCRNCSYDNKEGCLSQIDRYINHKDKNKMGTLYLFKVSYDGYTWLKVGVTNKLNPYIRYNTKDYSIFKFELLGYIHAPNIDIAVLESYILDDIDNVRYKVPHNIKFVGRTECFTSVYFNRKWYYV